MLPDPDGLIRALIAFPSLPASAQDRPDILHHLGQARFSDRVERAGDWSLLGYGVVGLRHPTRRSEMISEGTLLTCAEAHICKRIRQGEWAPDTTTTEYVFELQMAASHVTATLYLGLDPSPSSMVARRMAGTSTRADLDDLGLAKIRNPVGLCVLVVYSADESCLVSGYTVTLKDADRFVARWKRRRQL